MGVMEIAYLGHSSFKLKGKNLSIVIDPYDSEKVGLKFPKTDADIVTISHDHFDHNKVENVTDVRKVITRPGEYEMNGVSIIGVSSFHDNQKGELRGKNTIYVYEIDGFRIAHLGDLGHTLLEKQLEEIGSIDVLLIPVGGYYTIDSAAAVEVAQSIEPRIIIPMHYNENNRNENLEPVDAFVKQIALTPETLPKLVLKDALPEGEQKLIILEHK
jgi:L-ascorbate metabolism protein UlaG (beta-lactamase superfamily)